MGLWKKCVWFLIAKCIPTLQSNDGYLMCYDLMFFVDKQCKLNRFVALVHNKCELSLLYFMIFFPYLDSQAPVSGKKK
jgi:hypothetical protein